MLERRGFRIGFATVVLFTVLAGDAWRYSISWYGWGVLVLGITVAAITLLAHNRGWAKQLPYSLVAFLVLATVSITWSFYPGASALGVTAQWLTTVVALSVAITLSWDELLSALGLALRLILGLSLVFELVISLFVRHPVLPFWVDYGGHTRLPKLLYWSRDVLFTDGKIQGIVGNSSLLAMIALFGLIVFAVQLAAGTVGRLGGIAWLVLAALTAAITRSATIFIGIAVCAALLIAILCIRRARTPRARAGVYWSITGVILIGATLTTVFGRQLLTVLGKSADLTGRVGIWDAVIGLAQQRPAFGWGWVSYWVPWVAPFNHLVTRAGVQQLHAHNAWLDVWLQLGILGLVVFGAFVLITILRAWFVATDRPQFAPDAQGRYTATSLLPILILAALVVQSLAESRLLVEYGWLLLVVLAVKMKQREPVRTRMPAVRTGA